MHAQQEGSTSRGRTAVVLGMIGALAIGGVSAASGPTPAPPPEPVERAEVVVRVDPHDIRSGDQVLHRDEPPAVTPAVPLEAGRNELGEASPWSGMWGPEIEPLAAYEPQTRCLSGARPAVAAFAQLLGRAYPQSRDLGIARACEAGARSEHKEGRAYDWGVRVTVPSERMAAEELVAWLLATDEHGNDFAMARRLGVMYVIWDGHIWSASAADEGWRVYRGASPHTDHVHLSFSWMGAIGGTSFWDAARLGPWLLGDVAVERLPSSLDLGRDRYRSELGDEPGAMRTWGVPAEPAAEADDEAEPTEAPVVADGPTSGSPAPSPTTTVAPPPPASTEPVGGLVGPVLDAPLQLDPVDPAVAPPTTVPLVPDASGTVDEVVEGVSGSADALTGS